MARRQRLIWLSPEELAELMFGGVAFVAHQDGEPLPAGMEVVNAAWCPHRGQLAVTVQHSAFEPVPNGDVLPALLTRLRE